MSACFVFQNLLLLFRFWLEHSVTFNAPELKEKQKESHKNCDINREEATLQRITNTQYRNKKKDFRVDGCENNDEKKNDEEERRIEILRERVAKKALNIVFPLFIFRM